MIVAWLTGDNDDDDDDDEEEEEEESINSNIHNRQEWNIGSWECVEMLAVVRRATLAFLKVLLSK